MCRGRRRGKTPLASRPTCNLYSITKGQQAIREAAAAMRDLVRCGLPRPELVVVDGAPGLEKALAALWPDMAVQRCTVHYADLRIMPTSAAKPAWEAVIAVKDAA